MCGSIGDLVPLLRSYGTVSFTLSDFHSRHLVPVPSERYSQILGIRRLLFVTFDVTKKNFGIENNSFMFGHYMQMLACCTSCGA